MKKCRHCRTDNEDSATTCTECGLDLSPSPTAKFLARMPSAIRATDTKWLWRGFLIVAVPLLLLTFYFLSLGPILRFYGAKPSAVWSRVPSAVRVIYKPLDSLAIPQPVSRLLIRYNRWWMGVERDKKKLAALISHIDNSITNGMTQNQVLALLGQPVRWYTNASTVDAHYLYAPAAVYYGSTTNGFVITFSNGAVLDKSQITSEMDMR